MPDPDKLDRWLSHLRIIAFVNFALLALGAWLLGGDAFSGRVEKGRYFLGSNGNFVEVSHAIWLYSRIHVIANFVTFPLAVFGDGLVELGRFLARAADRRPPPGP